MSTIDISKGFRKYTPEELRNYGYSGVLECNGYPLSDFLEYLLTGYFENLLEETKAEAYDSGYEAGKADYVLPEGVVEQIQKAIKILEDI